MTSNDENNSPRTSLMSQAHRYRRQQEAMNL